MARGGGPPGQSGARPAEDALFDLRQLQAKFRGALLGGAVGDALGAPFEGRATVEPAEVARHLRRLGTLVYTDDTQMTLGLAESLVERLESEYPNLEIEAVKGGQPHYHVIMSLE